MTEHFDAIQQRFLRRRTFLQLSGLSAAYALCPPAMANSQPGFKALAWGSDQDLNLAEGYSAKLLIAWGTDLASGLSPQFPITAEAQASSFGYNNDFLAYMPLEGSNRGLLGINHEYPIGHLMFPGYKQKVASRHHATPDQAACEMAAVGHSVIEVKRTKQGWEFVSNSPYRRRITATTPMAFDGPAAGHRLLRTKADPAGQTPRGTMGCCSGGKTPWGTVLIAEENVGDFFAGADKTTKDSIAQIDQDDVHTSWAKIDPRFDLQKEPNELNRFGWIVEYNPYDATSTPVKHTALGRCEHEGATVVAVEDQPLVVYCGDDTENEFVYKFVSKGVYKKDNGPKNSALFSEGTLFCARFADDGSGEWLPLIYGEGPLTKSNGFSDQGEVQIFARRAARLLGATPMDRPEGIAINPSNGNAFVALTKNKNKPEANAANPRRKNRGGHVLEIIPPRRANHADHASTRFNWDILFQGGDPTEQGDQQGVYPKAMPNSPWLTNPDNLNFDPQGRLWIATDGMEDFGNADGLWCMTMDNPARSMPRQFLRCPIGAEPCSPEFTPDGETLFVSIQHPGDSDGSTFGTPSTRWPDLTEANPPRPGVVAITRDEGGPIGA